MHAIRAELSAELHGDNNRPERIVQPYTIACPFSFLKKRALNQRRVRSKVNYLASSFKPTSESRHVEATYLRSTKVDDR